MSVLSKTPAPNFAQDFARATLLSRMMEAAQKKSQMEAEAVAGRYTQKINSLRTEADQWRKLETEIDNSARSIGLVAGNVRTILSRIDNMLSSIGQADQRAKESGANLSGFPLTFDSLLRGFERMTKQSGAGNMLSSNHAKMTFKTNFHGATQTIYGNDLAPSYRIVDNDGNKWVPDHDAKLLRQYDSSGTATGKTASLEHGLRLDDLNGNDVTFTVNPDTASPEQITGTLTQTGTQVMDAWLYDGLATEDGRARARADLHAAREAIELEARRYEVSQSLADFYKSRAAENGKGLGNQVTDLRIEQAKAVGKKQEELAAQYNLAQGRIATGFKMRNLYTNFLGIDLGRGNPFKSLMNLSA